MARVIYRKAWEAWYLRSSRGRAAFVGVADKIAGATRTELRRTGLLNDPPAREYIKSIYTAPTAKGARVYTTASRAHLVEWGTVDREPDAPMRNAARRFGRFTEG